MWLELRIVEEIPVAQSDDLMECEKGWYDRAEEMAELSRMPHCLHVPSENVSGTAIGPNIMMFGKSKQKTGEKQTKGNELF